MRGGAPLLTEAIDTSQPYRRGLPPGSYRLEFESIPPGARGAIDLQVGTTAGDPIDLPIAR